MDASRAPCSLHPGMVMSRYHRIPGPCILLLDSIPERSERSPEKGIEEERIFSPIPFSSPVYLPSHRSLEAFLSLSPSPESNRTQNSRPAVHALNARPFTLSFGTQRQITWQRLVLLPLIVFLPLFFCFFRVHSHLKKRICSFKDPRR